MRHLLFRWGGSICILIALLGFSSNPPTGHTGAPFDAHCNNCHSPGNPNNFAGTVTVRGLPTIVLPNTLYMLTLTMRATEGFPARGGFQLTIVDSVQQMAGQLLSIGPETGVESAGDRQYVEHRGALSFDSDSIRWRFNWRSPQNAAGNLIRLYYIGNFCDGGSTSGDLPVAGVQTRVFSGSPPPLRVSLEKQLISCFNGSDGRITVNASGGTAPYQYQWNNGATTSTVENLLAGTYTVTVRDAAGTTISTSDRLEQPLPLALNINVSGAITCAQPTVQALASASGGKAPYTWSWSNTQTVNPATFQQGDTHYITIQDANGCVASAGFDIPIDTTAPIIRIATPDTLHCLQTRLTLDAGASSSGPAITYHWTSTDGRFLSGQNTPFPVVDTPGTYQLSLKNTLNGCTAATQSVRVVHFEPISAVPDSVGSASCPDATDGVAVVEAIGGAMPYRYSWSNGATTSIAAELTPGNYSATVTDRVGCSAAIGVNIVFNDAEAPILTCPKDTTIFDTDTLFYPLPTISDNCTVPASATPIRLEGLASGQRFPPGISVQKFAWADTSGNSATCTFTVTTNRFVSTQNHALTHLKVWPNPVQDRLLLSLHAPEGHRPLFHLFDMTGSLVRTEQLDHGVNEIDVADLPKGIYFWTLEAGDVRIGNFTVKH
jgi:hypothetical protein